MRATGDTEMWAHQGMGKQNGKWEDMPVYCGGREVKPPRASIGTFEAICCALRGSQWQVKKWIIPFDALICVCLTVFPLYLGLGSSIPFFWTLLFSLSRSHLSWWTWGQFLRVPAEGMAHVRQDGYRSPQDLWWRHRGMLTSLVYVVVTTPIPQKWMFYIVNFIHFCKYLLFVNLMAATKLGKLCNSPKRLFGTFHSFSPASNDRYDKITNK